MNFPDATSRIIVQGMTGKEGMRMARWMISSGANIVAGVTPGKGGQEIEGRPIFNSVKEAQQADASCIVVPAAHVLSAAKEALEAGISFVHVLTENVSLHDAIEMRRLAKEKGAMLLGPASVGFLSFPSVRIGYLGGEKPFNGHIASGDIALISTSGGMTNELMAALSRQNLGIRWALAVGGGQVVGLSLSEAVRLAEADPTVKRIAVFAEPGQPILRELRRGRKPSKPFVLMLPGAALDMLPRGLPYGHTGTILGENEPSVVETRNEIREHGTFCASTVPEFVSMMMQTYV